MAFIPTSSPRVFTSAPPEFPALMAASVCMNDSMPFAPSERAFALTMPAVTVELRLKGFPTASTHSPTFSLSLSPIGRAGRLEAVILMSARSVVLSVPMMRAEYSLLSLRVTVSSSAPSTTWLFVTIYPSVEMMTPDPAPSLFGVCTFLFCLPPFPPGLPKNPNGSKKSPKGSDCTSTVCTLLFCRYLMCTTDGRAFSAAYVRSTGWLGTALVAAIANVGVVAVRVNTAAAIAN